MKDTKEMKKVKYISLVIFEVNIVLILNHYNFQAILRMDAQILGTRSPRELKFVPWHIIFVCPQSETSGAQILGVVSGFY
jgi:hypothetical protein